MIMSPRSPSRIIILAAFLALAWWTFFRSSPYTSGLHEIAGVALPPLDFLTATTNRQEKHAQHYASREAREFCAAHGYSVYTPQRASGERKVYDLMMVNTELDFLEIRLQALYDYVDYFIIVESPKTFQGDKKPLVIADNWDKFRRYHDKMIYHELTYPKSFNPKRAWDYEDLQRDAMFEQAMKQQKGPKAPIKGDVIVVSDVDEIPRPKSLLVLRTCSFPRRLTLGSKFYYYSFQFLHRGPEWQHPQATFYQGWRTIKPTNLRNGDGGLPWFREQEKGVLNNAGWHCSSCFATMEQFLNKIASFSHGWMNDDEYRDRDKIANAVRHGKDVWDRDEDRFDRVLDNQDVPPLILQEKERFGYMTSRDGPSAGFKDYP